MTTDTSPHPRPRAAKLAAAASPAESSGISLPLARLLEHAADAVQAVRAGQSLNDALARCPLDARPGTQALSFHALRWLGAAQAVRALLAPKAPPPAVDALLLTALALLWPAAEAPYAAHTLVDQAVEAARRRAKASASFVNAVLRRFLREQEAIVAAALRDPVSRFNHPAWWVDRLKRDWPDRWQALLAADNQHPPMTLRVNARRGAGRVVDAANDDAARAADADRHGIAHLPSTGAGPSEFSAADYVTRLAEQGIAAIVAGPQAVVLERPRPVTQLPGFAQGDVSVQDASAQLAAPLLIGAGLLAGARVLDACAAPGGKTAHLLELADLDVLALDRDAGRLTRVTETLARIGLTARTLAADAGDTAWWDGRPFDAILLDAPCSASGIVRRHPDVRWLRRASDIPALAKIQADLLDALWPLLAPGGRLLYCTCSVFKAEGQDQIDAFLQRHADALVPADPASPGHLLPLPDNDDESAVPAFGAPPDGFFYTLLQKT